MSTRDLKQPRFWALRRAQAVEVLDDSKEDVLKEVVGLDAGGDASSEERSQRWRKGELILGSGEMH